MPKTDPRTLRLGGIELSLTLDRAMVERVKASSVFRLATRRGPAGPKLRDGEPELDGVMFEDIDWYQTIDLPGGVTTPGFVDHRAQVGLYGLPESLEGKRCLDVATFDGFWAFEMERRGAAEVVGIDVHSLRDTDMLANYSSEYRAYNKTGIVKGQGFAYAKRMLGSSVKRKVLSVYELSPDRVGMFDFVFLSDLLIHLRDPLRALEALWTVTAGDAVIAEVFDRSLEDSGEQGAVRFHGGMDEYSGFLWWYPTTSALMEMIRLARFQDVREVSRFDLEARGRTLPKAVYHARGGTED